MRILVAGAGGQLGRLLAEDFAATHHDVAALTRADLNVSDETQVASIVNAIRPDVIVNCTAYNHVDRAESEPAAAFATNAIAPGLLADAARQLGAVLVHYSTDFVFDGAATTPYTESCETNPLSVYGLSKLRGEQAAARAPRHYVLRIESVFGGVERRSTIDRIADSLLDGRPVRAFVDRTVSPSYIPDVIAVTRSLLEQLAPYGTYHCVNSGHTTWFDMAIDIASRLAVPAKIEPAHAADVTTPAARPHYCALSNAKLQALGIRLPDWQDAIARHLSWVLTTKVEGTSHYGARV